MEITFDDFKKLDIRIGEVEEAEQVPESRNLIKLIVDFGFGHSISLILANDFQLDLADNYHAHPPWVARDNVVNNLEPTYVWNSLDQRH